MQKISDITINEYGDEEHESWLLIRANRVSGSSRHLFDSEIAHHHYIQVEVDRCSRKRDLNHDWIHARKRILEITMSEAQWGAFVSSFGNGRGVPATLNYLNGQELPTGKTPQAPFQSRLDESHREVKSAGDKALSDIAKAYNAVQKAFDGNLGKVELRARLSTLRSMVQNGPANMEFAAESLTEHVENVVTKARADIEGMVLHATAQGHELTESAGFHQLTARPSRADDPRSHIVGEG